MSDDLARAIVTSLDDEALDQLARLLAPRLAGATSTPASLTVEQAAHTAGVSARTIRRALNAGLLDGRQVAGRWQTTTAGVSAWQAAGGPTVASGPLRSARPGSRAPTARAADGADAILGRVDR
jgi:hypothetical protein